METRASSKHTPDPSPDFQGFLNNLQDWETSLNDKGKKKISQVSDKAKPNKGLVGENRRPMAKKTINGSSSSERQKYSLGNFSSSVMTEESSPDAASEKDLGNEYFKQKKFNEAIDCYSRSIALSPTAVAYANRAMAYLKIKRFKEAESDCTEALDLDDRNIKAYSRRSTARKELGKLKQSVEDAEFALRLEPQNQEVKKQYTESKSLYDKEMLNKVSAQLTKSTKEVQKTGKLTISENGQAGVSQSVPSNAQKKRISVIQDDQEKDSGGRVPTKSLEPVVEVESKIVKSNNKETERLREDVAQSSRLERAKGNERKQEPKPSVQKLAARAASLSQPEAVKHIIPPTTAYQFEVSWRGLAGDCTLQARLLKVTSPAALPQIFKNALSAPILIGIIRCIATFVIEDMDLAVEYLQNLTLVARFDMIIMCLSPADRRDVYRIWNEVFCSSATPIQYAERLDELRPRYCNSSRYHGL